MITHYQSFRTTQITLHKDLVTLVMKHKDTAFQRPIPSHQIDAFREISTFAKELNRPVIIDSGCGTGLSSHKLAKLFPDHAIVGIDKSKARLERALHPMPHNLLLVRGRAH